ncbi:MAG: hypothetical protein COB51_01815 [Moraxellaceae bacterium]|nr:MAG: hypothetical protein COB51_01815 [Moraxellaceae bacterium]
MKHRVAFIFLSLSFLCVVPGITLGVVGTEFDTTSELNDGEKSPIKTPFALQLKPFSKGSMETIKSQRKGSAFIVVLWSVDCPPCYEELEMWRRVKASYPALDVVLISTDAMALNDEVRRVVEKMGVAMLEHWQFADAFVEPLRYEIDPGWSGELPRTYFYSATGEYVGRSGIIKQDKIEAWIE